MKKFVFELQTLQDVKKREEDSEKIQLKKIEEKLSELIAELERLDFELKHTQKSFTEEVANLTKADKLNQYDNYLKKTAELILLQRDKIEAVNQKKSECINRLIEIQKELKSLDKLKQKKYEEHLKEEMKEAEKLMDDIVSFKTAAS
jgi:flagellar FliJ protein